MKYHLKLKTGFFKKEPIDLEVVPTGVILKKVSKKEIFIKGDDILSIDIIDKYENPELEIHTNQGNYLIYLDDLSQEAIIYKNLSKLFKDKFKH